MKLKEIWLNLAIRKVKFHQNESPEDIKCWGLAFHSDIKYAISKGYIKESFGGGSKRALRWYRPTAETYTNFVEPLVLLIERYDLLPVLLSHYILEGDGEICRACAFSYLQFERKAGICKLCNMLGTKIYFVKD